MARQIFIITATVAIFLGVFTGLFLISQRKGIDDQVACTEEAKLCPDGSSVGRTGPQCEFAACPTSDEEGDGLFRTSGIVVGSVSIGPLCPVEPCDRPVGDMYSSRSLIFMPQGGGRPVDVPFTVPLTADGSFIYELPESDYSVTLTNCQFMGCSYSFPKSLRVEANTTTTLDITLDTGIR